MTARYTRELETAVEAALAAGEVTERYFGTDALGTRHKVPGHPVTAADLEADAVIHAIISKAFPDDGWLSEETADSTERLAKHRVWIVDPIDGTKEFIAGIPEYVISIGLAVDGAVVAGAVYQPTRGMMFQGECGNGATLDGRSLRVATERSARPKILVSRTETRKGRWKPHEEKFAMTPCGSIAYKICRVASGEVDGAVTIEPRSEWDLAGAAAILKAAGGRLALHDESIVAYNNPRPVTPTGVIAGSEEFIRFCSGVVRGGSSA